MLWTLFWSFFKMGLVSFGGGYAMIPVMEHEANIHSWMTAQEFSDAVAVAGMSPGPIATNSAIYIGYKTAGFAGAIVSAAGMILPSLLIIIAAAAFFFRINHLRGVKSVFYGLKPVIAGLVIYAAFHYAVVNGIVGAPTWQMWTAFVIFVLGIIAMLRYRLHPLLVIAFSGVAGAAVFS